MLTRLLTTTALLSVVSSAQASVTLKAKVSTGGVKGTVTFIQANPGEAVALTFALHGPRSAAVDAWEFHQHRVNYDTNLPCSASSIGARRLENVGGQPVNASVSGFHLSGYSSIEGTSIALLENGQIIACATVESSEEYVTARAVFRRSIFGHVTFRQLKSQPAALTQVTYDLYYDRSRTTSGVTDWRVLAAESTDCTSVGETFTPSSAHTSGTCTSSAHTSCAVGDLSGKLGQAVVGGDKGDNRTTTLDLNLPLSGASGVTGHVLLLYTDNEALACAPIVLYATRSGVATFDDDGVTGTITLTQPSPLDEVRTRVKLSGLQAMAGGYHVHVFPVAQRVTADQALCSADDVGGHFNPFGIVYNADSPAAAVSTNDAYEVGDLSKKHGMLNGLESVDVSYTDTNLQLFGPNSVLGRSVVIHKNLAGAPRWVCASIHDTAAVTVAMATFTFPVAGYVMFEERQGDLLADTWVYTRLDYADGSVQSTSDHAFILGSRPVSDDVLHADVSTRCASTGDVLNPYNVDTAHCLPEVPLTCAQGDLWKRHGSLSVRTASGKPALAFFTDSNLPLTGPKSIVGKSLVLMAPDMGPGRLACADVTTVMPRTARASAWGSTTFGTITFTQISGVVQRPTTIDFSLQSLRAESGGTATRIHTRPVSPETAGRCQNVGSVYTPFPTTSTTHPTKDKIPTGDLAAKFGLLNQATYTHTHVDPSLSVCGPRSVVGRALSLAVSEDVYACSDVTITDAHGGKLMEAEAVFTGDVTGTIVLRQYLYPDASMSDTTVIVDLKKTTGAQTAGHNWHTHVNPVGKDTADKPCQSCGGHYNPFLVNVTDHYDECTPDNPLRCELGDQSSKLGTYTMGSGRMVATDVYLPLVGRYGVIGRSIVVHAENKGAPRIACADIVPLTLTNTFTIIVGKQASEIDRLQMRETVAGLVQAEIHDVYVHVIRPEDCGSTVRIYFLGLDGQKRRQHFTDILSRSGDGVKSAMGDYTPTTCSASTSMMSLVLLLTSFIFGRWLS